MHMQEASMTLAPAQVVDVPSLKLEVSLWEPSTKLTIEKMRNAI